MQTGFTVDDLGGDSVSGLRLAGGDIALTQIFKNLFDWPFERIAEAATAGTLDADRVVPPQPVVAKSRWQRFFLW